MFAGFCVFDSVGGAPGHDKATRRVHGGHVARGVRAGGCGNIHGHMALYEQTLSATVGASPAIFAIFSFLMSSCVVNINNLLFISFIQLQKLRSKAL